MLNESSRRTAANTFNPAADVTPATGPHGLQEKGFTNLSQFPEVIPEVIASEKCL
jgi:hypothetical protein